MTQNDLKQIKIMLEENNTKLFGQLSRYVEGHIGDLQSEMTDRFDRLETAMDGLAQRTTVDEAERAAIMHEQFRHRGWIGQLAKTTGTKLVPEQ